MRMEKVFYFGYGVNKEPKMMRWITGNPNLKGKPAVLRGYKLCVQRLDQVPDTVFPTAPVPVSPRTILKDNWGESFTSYTIKEDPEDEVHGTLWELTLQDRELVRDWELIDFGWYKDLKVKIETEDSQEIEVQTEGIGDGQGYDREVNGTNYETWLNLPVEFERVATKSREDYFARLRKTSEGVSL